MKRKVNKKTYIISTNLLERPLSLFLFLFSKVYIFNYIYLILLLLNYWWFICLICYLFNIVIEEFGHIAAAGGRKTLTKNNIVKFTITYVSLGCVPLIMTQAYVNTNVQNTSPVDSYHIFAGGPLLSLVTTTIIFILSLGIFNVGNLSICIGVSLLSPIISLLPLNLKIFVSSDGYKLKQIRKRHEIGISMAIMHLGQAMKDIIAYCLHPRDIILEVYKNELQNPNLNNELDKLYEVGDYQMLLFRYKEIRRHVFSNSVIDNNIAWLLERVYEDDVK